MSRRKALIIDSTATTLQERVAKKIANRHVAVKRDARALDRVALLDSSSSMYATDAVGTHREVLSRWDALNQAWKRLAPLMTGRLAAYTFGAVVVPVRGSATGAVDLGMPGGSTYMCEAIKASMKHAFVPGLRVLLVSDGEPTDGDPTSIVQSVLYPIDCIYVGPKGGRGADLLRRIADITGGEFRDFGGKFDTLKFLEAATHMLMLGGGDA
jgi:hypothetical protein